MCVLGEGLGNASQLDNKGWQPVGFMRHALPFRAIRRHRSYYGSVRPCILAALLGRDASAGCLRVADVCRTGVTLVAAQALPGQPAP